MRVAFVHHETINPRKARWINISRTLVAACRHAEVTWFTPETPESIDAYMRDHLALQRPETLRVETLGSWRKKLGMTLDRVFLRNARNATSKGFDHVWTRADTVASYLAPRVEAPVLHEFHQLAGLWSNDVADSRKNARNQRREATIIESASAIAVKTRAMADALHERYDTVPTLDVVANAVDTDIFRPTYLGPQDKQIAYIGSIQAWKGLDTLVRALGDLADYRLRLIGSGKDAEIEALKALASEVNVADRIEWLGQIPQSKILDHLADVSCLVHPLPKDDEFAARHTSPMKLFEYLATGIPIVASDVPSVREVLTNGATAILCRPSDSDDLARAIRETENAAEMKNLALNAVSESKRYSYDALAKRILALMGANA